MVASLLALLVLSPGQSPSIPGLDGKSHSPLAEAKGRVVGLVFISHDCPICNTYAPELKRIAQQFTKQGAVIDFVYAEPDLSVKAAKAHAKSYGYQGVHLFLDPKGDLAKYCGAKITPEAIVVDPGGQLVYRGRIDDLFLGLGRQRPKAQIHNFRDALTATLHHKTVDTPAAPAVGCYISTVLS